MNEPQSQRFHVSATWSGDGAGRGEVRLHESESVAVAGDPGLGGSGRAANPEQLLLAALAACFLNTWAIFLKKLSIPFSEPALAAECEVGPDPAGGFRVTGVTLRARVPAAVAASHREPLRKTLSLAEKYCIVSKVVRAGVPMRVELEEA